MWAARYWPGNYFAARYWPKVGSDIVAGSGAQRAYATIYSRARPGVTLHSAALGESTLHSRARRSIDLTRED